jgi:DNA-binding winged helix-turn-helix (wHTH) protein
VTTARFAGEKLITGSAPERAQDQAVMIDAAASPVDEAAPAVTYRFGPYILDVTKRRLLRGSTARPLTEKVFQVFRLLLDANGGVVDKHEFFARVWPEEERSEANLTQQIFLLRGILGERAGDHAYIVTIPGRGYRFAGAVETKGGLAMKGSCERCGQPLPMDADAFICSYECTLCAPCAAGAGRICPNCGGEQVRRPRR